MPLTHSAPLIETPTGAEASQPLPRYDAEYSYVLDCAVELGEITPLEHAVFFAPTTAARQLARTLELRQAWPKHFMRNLARDYLGQLSRPERYVWALKGAQGMEYALKSLQERIEFVVQAKVQNDLGVTEREAIRWMDEASDPAVFGQPVFLSVHDVQPDKVLGFAQEMYRQTWELLHEDLQLLQEAVEWLDQPGARAQAHALARCLFAQPNSASPAGSSAPVRLPSVRRVTQTLRAQKAQKRQARGAIKKALKLLSSFGLKKDVQLLVSGHEAVLSHPGSPFKFVVQPLQKGWLQDKTVRPGGHVPFQLSLLTKEDVFLSRLCVLFDATPVLDQLLALSLFVQSGNEMELLQKANWFGAEDPFVVKAILQTKAPALAHKVYCPDTAPQRAADGARARLDSMLSAHRVEEAHWAPFKQPVSQWLSGWFEPLKRQATLLSEQPQARALAQPVPLA